MRSRLFFTGEAGLIATALAARLEGKYEIIRPFGTDVLLTPTGEVDILNQRTIEALKRILKVDDTVIHCAAYTGTEKCDRYAYDAVKVNVVGVENICDLVLETGANLVAFSTTAIHRPGIVPLTETSPIDPRTLYGLSKAIGETIVREKLRNRDSWTIVRPVFLYGDAPKDNASMIRRILEAIRRKKQVIVLLDPQCVKDYFRIEYFTVLFDAFLEEFIQFFPNTYNDASTVILSRGAGKPFQVYLDHIEEVTGVGIQTIKRYVTFEPTRDYLGDHLGASIVFPKICPTFSLPPEAFDDELGIRKTWESVCDYVDRGCN
jgi:dTDP-4-dehydrorhamnose reductase